MREGAAVLPLRCVGAVGLGTGGVEVPVKSAAELLVTVTEGVQLRELLRMVGVGFSDAAQAHTMVGLTDGVAPRLREAVGVPGSDGVGLPVALAVLEGEALGVESAVGELLGV